MKTDNDPSAVERVRVKESETRSSGGRNPIPVEVSRVTEVDADKIPAGAVVTDEPLSDWTAVEVN